MLQGFNHLFSDRFALSYLFATCEPSQRSITFSTNSSDKHNIVLKQKEKKCHADLLGVLSIGFCCSCFCCCFWCVVVLVVFGLEFCSCSSANFLWHFPYMFSFGGPSFYSRLVCCGFTVTL